MIKSLKTYKILLIIGIFAVFLLLFFARQRFQNREITKIEVDFTRNSNHFLSQKMLITLLKKNMDNSVKMYVNAVDLNKLEAVLNDHKMIEKAEVFFNGNAEIVAKVKQKEAIARVFDNGRSYYLDEEANEMPLSEIYSARVPLIYGKLAQQQKEGVSKLMKTILEDEFLKASVVAITMKSNKDVILYVRDFDFEVYFGPLEDIEEKLRKYKVFVQFYRKNKKEEVYKSINLNYNKQVICSK